jgi:hypothetical protein
MKSMKKVAVGFTAAVMMVGGAMTAFAGTSSTYFYLLRNGSYTAAPMGQDCVSDFTVSGNKVTLNLQEAEYVSNGQTYTGEITNAFIDKNNNNVYDKGVDTSLFVKGRKVNQIVYDKNPDAAGFTNFHITVDIPSFATKTFSVYAPDLN